MRTLARLVLLVTAVPLAAQVHVRSLANAGYDAGYAAPSVGLGAEVEWARPESPLSVALRPSVDVVFAESIPFVSLDATRPARSDASDSDVTRLGAEVLVRWTAAPGPAVPYLKAGVVNEYERIRSGDLVFSYWQAGAVAGAGGAVGPLYLEGTIGFGDASRHRLALGVRF